LPSSEQPAANPTAVTMTNMPSRAAPAWRRFLAREKPCASSCDKTPHPKLDSLVRELAFCMSVTLPRVMDDGQKSG
jgi:hypothetical protein